MRSKSPTRQRVGPPAPTTTPFYCPWCRRQIDDEGPHDHAYEHRDKAPKAYLIEEEYWPAGTATHCFAEGIE